MKKLKLKLKHLIFVFCALISIAAGTEHVDDAQPVRVGGNILCIKPAQTYCLHVVNYPREIHALFNNTSPVQNIDETV